MKTIDELNELVGKKFGKLTVISFAGRYNGYIYYSCKCDCGNIKEIRNDNLYTAKSCGCMRGWNSLADRKSKNLIGQRFGRLTVLEKTNKRYYGYVVWKCKCDCGNIVEVPMHNLSYNHMVKSCGCMLDENRKRFSNHNNIRYLIQLDDGTYYVRTCHNGYYYTDDIHDAGRFITIKHALKRAEWLKTECNRSYKIISIDISKGDE